MGRGLGCQWRRRRGGRGWIPFNLKRRLRARASGAGPITCTCAGLECCMHQIASSVRLRRLGLHRVGRSLDTIHPSRVALGPGRSSWARPRRRGGRAPRSEGPYARAAGRTRRASPSQPSSGRSPRGRWGLQRAQAPPGQPSRSTATRTRLRAKGPACGPEPGWTGDSESAVRRAEVKASFAHYTPERLYRFNANRQPRCKALPLRPALPQLPLSLSHALLSGA